MTEDEDNALDGALDIPTYAPPADVDDDDWQQGHYFHSTTPQFTYLPLPEDTTRHQVALEDLSNDQALAVDDVVCLLRDGQKVVTLGGYAGTGKSTLIPLIAKMWGSAAATAFCAPTGKAAHVLALKLKAAKADAAYVGTIHGLMYTPVSDDKGRIAGWQRNKILRTNMGNNIKRIIVDEASMLGNKLLEDLKSYGIPILLVGDHGQLQPVKDVSVLSHLDVRLETIHRQAANNPIIQLAHHIRTEGDIPYTYPESDKIRFFSRDKLYSAVKDAGSRGGSSTCILVRTNRERLAINMHCLRNRTQPVSGDLVICLKNCPPVFNGMRGRLKTITPKNNHWYTATVTFADEGVELIGTLNKHQFGIEETIGTAATLRDRGVDYRERKLGLLFDFGYAITGHKAQGSEFKEVVLRPHRLPTDSDIEYAQWLYTCVTRSSDRLSIVY